MSIGSPITLCLCLVLWIGIVAMARLRRFTIPRVSQIAISLGTLVLSLAAGQITLHLPDSRDVVVMVDQSASMRIAAYREPAALSHRIEQLLGPTKYRKIEFSNDSADRTVFEPPLDASAIVLFSDCRFDLPATAPPTYVVVDPNLEDPADAAVANLRQQGDSIAVTVRNNSAARALQISGTQGPFADSVSRDQTVYVDRDPSASLITARLVPGDAWPENDTLSIRPTSSGQLQRWWIGADPPSAQWRTMKPEELPTEPGNYLAVSVIALQNIPADAISSQQQDRLSQFVRDLGGGLVILGGDHAYAAGNYVGSAIELLSPLASNPPGPQRNWIVLIDSSGSMASVTETGMTRWQRAAGAVSQVLPHLPPDDLIAIGSFARDLRWWSQGKTVRETLKLSMPPPDIAPSGPTNLQEALESIASQLRDGGRTEIILITDADATITDPSKLAGALTSAQSRVHLLATADASRSPLLRIVAQTAGRLITQTDPKLWDDAARQLLRGISPAWLQRTPANVEFSGSLAALPARSVELWNQTWPKRSVTEIASTPILGGAKTAMAGSWRLGAGAVAAAAFPANATEADALAAVVARTPRDPKFTVTWTAAENLTVRLDAAEGERFLNDLDVALVIGDENDIGQNLRISKLAQTAPGRYDASLPAPRQPSLANVRVGDRVIERFAVAGRYATEFDRIGNDHEAMQKLANLTVGAVIEPTHIAQIDFKRETRPIAVTSILASLSALLIAMGLVTWKFVS